IAAGSPRDVQAHVGTTSKVTAWGTFASRLRRVRGGSVGHVGSDGCREAAPATGSDGCWEAAPATRPLGLGREARLRQIAANPPCTRAVLLAVGSQGAASLDLSPRARRRAAWH